MQIVSIGDYLYEMLALVKALFSIQKYWYFSYFSTKTLWYSLEVPLWGTSNEQPQLVFVEK